LVSKERFERPTHLGRGEDKKSFFNERFFTVAVASVLFARSESVTQANITEALTEANKAESFLQEASLSVGTNKKATLHGWFFYWYQKSGLSDRPTWGGAKKKEYLLLLKFCAKISHTKNNMQE